MKSAAAMSGFPRGAAHVIAAVAGDAVARLLDAAEFLDVEVQQFTRLRVFVAHAWCQRRSGTLPTQNPAQGRFGQIGALADLGAGQALLAPTPYFLPSGRRDLGPTVRRPRRAVLQSRSSSVVMTRDPFTHGFRTDAESRSSGLQRLSLLQH